LGAGSKLPQHHLCSAVPFVVWVVHEQLHLRRAL
jgi:hypothetical protein